ncbi:MAG: FISUMP domain-containing protein [Melioribacteraceae bacterium]|nr:FISUMP domain-containing protein [Melioribacteraceae bacterium]
MKTLLSKKILLIILISLLLSTCKKEDSPTEPESNNPVVSDVIKVGTVVNVTSQSISSGGGTINITNAGSPLRGMRITIPPNTYSISKTFDISYSPIESHKLGTNFNPISPLIKISNGGGYADSPINIKIPIKKSKDDFALGFFYDASSGKLEALPLLDVDDSSVTVNTRHFSSTGVALGKRLNNDQSFSNLVISSIKESVISGQTVIGSGFTPGVDDWEFINLGSFISPKGHCAGQSLTAMWYFYEKKLKGLPSLFHRYDELNKPEDPSFIWFDNPLGYKFASTIQEDFDFLGWIRNVDIQSYLAPLTWKTFIAAMLITGQPQFVIIKNSVTNAGHAMIVYKIGVAEGMLYVADPNYPNNRHHTGVSSIRTIKYDNGKFQPYDSFMKVGDPGTTFDQIAFFGKTANIDWSQISKRFSEFENKTIGNDRFPVYKLKYKLNTERIELKDTLTTNLDTLDVIPELSAVLKLTERTVINDKGEKYNNPSLIPLEPGKRKYGFYFASVPPDHNKFEFVDFKWVVINYTKALSITSTESDKAPILIDGTKNKEYTFIANSWGTAPKNGKAKYEWSFGDGSSTTTVNNDSTVKHIFTKEGSFTIKCTLYDDTKKINEGTAIAKISPYCPQSIVYLGKTYNTVQIKTATREQCWFKENLDAGIMIDGSLHASNNNTIEKYCYDDLPSNCTKYGGLYQWNEAMQYQSKERAQGICPPGWHIPSTTDYIDLVYAFGNDGRALIINGVGESTNTSGFSGLIAGMRGLSSPIFYDVGIKGYIWSSTTNAQSTGNAGLLILGGDGKFASVYSSGYHKEQGFSLRCLKDF